MPTSSILQPFQLLEVNLISAQDLARVGRNMRTYANVWIHPDRKLSTRVETQSQANPTWNDKFVFRVDDDFLSGDTSAIMIEIYALHWFKDIHVGTVRVMVGNVVPPPAGRNNPNNRHIGMRFVALQVRRPSGRPQGILNVGVTILDSSMRSMPLYTQLGSAVGYRDIMGDSASSSSVNDNNLIQNCVTMLGRSRSDTSSLVSSDFAARRRDIRGNDKPGGSIVGGSEFSKGKGSSIISGSQVTIRKRKSKGGSIINGSEIMDPPNKGKNRGAPSSIVLGSDVGAYPNPNKKHVYWRSDGSNIMAKQYMTESELGPSPSEVAAAIAQRRPDEAESEILGTWNLDTSVEGLQTKLERWRAELPPVYDRAGDYSSYKASPRGQNQKLNEEGLFSCFGNICGIECSIVCGAKPPSGGRKRNDGNMRHQRSFSQSCT